MNEKGKTAKNELNQENTMTVPKPVYPRLRGYAFDPSLSLQPETAVVNETVYKVRWEEESAKPDDGFMVGSISK